MPDTDPVTVFVAPNVQVASVIAEWLLEKDIRAEVRAQPQQPHTDPLTGATTMEDPTGVEVLVIDPAKADEAKEVIAERAADMRAMLEKRQARAARAGTVTAVCEECGKPSEWPAADMGTTQDCPHCANYMDIPDPDENWDGVDFGAEDETEGDPAAK